MTSGRVDFAALLREGWTRYEIQLYEKGKDDALDFAVEHNMTPWEPTIADTVREAASGGEALTCWINLEAGHFVVYLPPEDRDWGSKSQQRPKGFAPSLASAKHEFANYRKGMEARRRRADDQT